MIKENPFKLVVNNEEKPKEQEQNKTDRINEGNPKQSLAERFFDSSDYASVDEIASKLPEDMPDILKNSIRQTAAEVKKSAESFDAVFEEKMLKLREVINEIKSLVQIKKLSYDAQVEALTVADRTEKWIPGTETAFEYYQQMDDSTKTSLSGKGMRNDMIEPFDSLINSCNKMKDTLLKAPDKK